MSEVLLPYVDFQVRDQFDEHARLVHERFASMTVLQFEELMPEATYPGNNDAAFLEFIPSRPDYDRNSSIILSHPHANGDSPHLGIRSMFLAELTGMRVFAFPNNTLGEMFYTLSDTDRATVADGDFSPISNKILRSVLGSTEKPSGVNRLVLAGYSLGGTIIASAFAQPRAHDFADVTAISCQEPPNAVGRTPKKLQKDFTSGGMGEVYQAMIQSGIPALREALAENKFKGWINLAKFALGTQLKPNRDIHKGMAKATLSEDLRHGLNQNPNTAVQLLVASDSRIFVYQVAKNIAEELHQEFPNSTIDSIALEGTHAVGDSVLNPALAVKRVIALAKAA
ncbi:MAG: hypothetical protein AAB459_01530 [Patescibacteria group bacterium]